MSEPPPPASRLPERFTMLWALAMLIASTVMILIEAPRFNVWPLDSYYYLSKANNLASHSLLVTSWGGVDAKFFPAYSLLVSPMPLLGEEWTWIAERLFVLWASTILIALIGENLLRDRAAAWAAAALWAAHPVMLKWATVPMSEVTATFLALAAVFFVLRGTRRPRAVWAVLAGACAGAAISTRAEMVALAMPLCLLWIFRRRVSRLRWLVWGTLGFLLGSVPLIFWALQLWFAGSGLHYLSEASSHPLDPQAWRYVHSAVYQVGFLAPVPSGVTLIDAWLLGVSCVFIATLVLALGGVLGAWALGAALVFVAYLGAHSLWHYHYERFLVPLLPAAALLLAGAGASWVDQSARSRPLRARIAIACLVITTLCWLFYGRVLIRDHRYWLSQGFPSSVADTAAYVDMQTPPGSPIFTDLGPTLAYHLDRPVVFTEGIPDFYPAAFASDEATAQIVQRGACAVVTRRSFSDWCRAYAVPEAARAGFRPVPLGGTGTILFVDHARLLTALESPQASP